MRDVLTLERLEAMDPDAAAALLVYRRADGAGDLDARVLAAWLQRDPAHARAWDNACAAWSDFDDAGDDEILAALQAHARRAGPARPRWSPPLAAAAAAVLLALGVGLGVVGQRAERAGEASRIAAAPAAASYEAVDHTEEVRLADGSRLLLAAGAAATVSLEPGRRQVDLTRGQAYFDVAPDPQRRFVVRAAGQQIVALGTQFDVLLRPDELRVILVEGQVAVGPPGATAPILLSPGQQLVLREGQPPRVSPAEAGEVLVLEDRYVVFDDAPLAEAVAELNRHGPGRLIVRDPGIAALRISGRFRAGDPERFGRSLSLLHPVRIERRGAAEWEIVPRR